MWHTFSSANSRIKAIFSSFAFFLPLTLFSSPAFALDYSVFGSMNLSNYHMSDSSGVKASSGLGWGWGTTLGFELSPFLSLESGILFLSHSYSLDGSLENPDRKLNYFDVPVLIRFKPLAQFAFYLGPYYGIDTGFSTSDLGLMAGLGPRWILSDTLQIRVDAFYQFGFLNLDSMYSTQNSRNLIFSVGVVVETW